MELRLSDQLKQSSEDLSARDARYTTDLEQLERKFNDYTADLVAKNQAALQQLETTYNNQNKDL